jgi:hypothetical protein
VRTPLSVIALSYYVSLLSSTQRLLAKVESMDFLIYYGALTVCTSSDTTI